MVRSVFDHGLMDLIVEISQERQQDVAAYRIKSFSQPIDDGDA
jgi:hypothetical protein